MGVHRHLGHGYDISGVDGGEGVIMLWLSILCIFWPIFHCIIITLWVRSSKRQNELFNQMADLAHKSTTEALRWRLIAEEYLKQLNDQGEEWKNK
jgi:hypothetical protein